MLFNSMRPDFKIFRLRKLGRALPLVGVFVAFLFVIFNVLDVDGSSLLNGTMPVEGSIVSAEAPSDVAINRLDRAELWEHSALLPDGLEDAWLQVPESPGWALFHRARAHGYHAGLPRDALSDVLPA
jgi:hypothetical protein